MATTTSPPTTTTTTQATPQYWNEQSVIRNGVPTFRNYHNASERGDQIGYDQVVQVSCKVYDPYIQSVNPDGYWYRIHTAPWNDIYYAAANTFLNGDPHDGPYSRNTDWAIRDC
jgi:hypothetical protein